jgi:hypothetical protein
MRHDDRVWHGLILSDPIIDDKLTLCKLAAFERLATESFTRRPPDEQAELQKPSFLTSKKVLAHNTLLLFVTKQRSPTRQQPSPWIPPFTGTVFAPEP